MNDRSNEIIKQLNRLANDRNLALNVRNKVRDALHHIQDLKESGTTVPEALSPSTAISLFSRLRTAPWLANPSKKRSRFPGT